MWGKIKCKVEKFLLVMLILVVCVVGRGSVECAASESNEIRIEQAKINMPDIKVYYYPGSGIGADISANLKEEKLQLVDNYAFRDEEEGAEYYILVDISLSISSDYLNSIRQAILEFHNRMRDQDTLTIITFGDTVTVVAEKASRTTNLSDVVNGINLTDYTTHLFEALNKMAQMADCAENQVRRVAAIVITDGEDCSTKENTKNQALEKLQKAGITLYSMAVKETAGGEANEFISDFSDFTRETHGVLFTFGKEDAVNAINQICGLLDSCQVLKLRAKSNRIVSVMQPLTVIASGTASETIQVCPRYYQQDQEPPKAEVQQNGPQGIAIKFSEPVINADQLDNYSVVYLGISESSEQTEATIKSVSYIEEQYQAELTLEQPLKNGGYQIKFENITDVSLEENPVDEYIEVLIENGESQTETERITESEIVSEPESETVQEEGIRLNQTMLIGIGTAAVAILVLIIFLLKRRKNREVEEEVIPPLSDNLITFDIHSEEGDRRTQAAIQEKLIVGRLSSCNISVLDDKLSKQHFMIEKDSGSYYLTDLQSTNGTKVNGIKVAERYKLKNGDVVQAGSLTITISW